MRPFILARRRFFSKLFEEAGKYSLQIYLFNGYFLTLTRELVVSKVKLFRTLTGLV